MIKNRIKKALQSYGIDPHNPKTGTLRIGIKGHNVLDILEGLGVDIQCLVDCIHNEIVEKGDCPTCAFEDLAIDDIHPNTVAQTCEDCKGCDLWKAKP